MVTSGLCVRVAALCFGVALVAGCGGSEAGGSGNGELRLSKPSIAISPSVGLDNICQSFGFPMSYVFTADYDGNLMLGDRIKMTAVFQPSGGILRTSGPILGDGITSKLTQRDISIFDCVIAGSDTMQVDLYITVGGVKSNTVSATVDIQPALLL